MSLLLPDKTSRDNFEKLAVYNIFQLILSGALATTTISSISGAWIGSSSGQKLTFPLFKKIPYIESVILFRQRHSVDDIGHR
jgi:hypothetical protein